MQQSAKMKTLTVLLLTVVVLAVWATAYHPDFTWQNVDTMMNGDLRHRMSKKIPTRRRYCDCSEVDDADKYPICASNGALYENVCLFDCAKVRWPDLSVVAIESCGSHTFKEFKLGEFCPHY